MARAPNPLEIYFFSNGNTAVCRDGKQVPELQEAWLQLFREFLERNRVDPAECLLYVPNGLKGKFFRTDIGWNWEVTP